MAGDDAQLRFQRAQLIIGDHDLRPYLALQRLQRLLRRAFQQQLPGGNDGHARAKLADIFDDVGGEDHRDVAADRGEQIQKAVALRRVEARGGLVDNDQAWLAQQRLGDAEALLHAAGIGAQRLLAKGPKIGLLQQRFDHLFALARLGDAFHHRKVRQQVDGGYLRINTEFLRQVAQRLANRVLFFQNVDPIQKDRPAVRLLQGRNGAHQRALARAVRPQQAEHVVADGE